MRRGFLPKTARGKTRVESSVFFFTAAFVLGCVGGYFSCRALNGVRQGPFRWKSDHRCFTVGRGGGVLSCAVDSIPLQPVPVCVLPVLLCVFWRGAFAGLCRHDLCSGVGPDWSTDRLMRFRHPAYFYFACFAFCGCMAVQPGCRAKRETCVQGAGSDGKQTASQLACLPSRFDAGCSGRNYFCAETCGVCHAICFMILLSKEVMVCWIIWRFTAII